MGDVINMKDRQMLVIPEVVTPPGVPVYSAPGICTNCGWTDRVVAPKGIRIAQCACPVCEIPALTPLIKDPRA